MEAARARVRPRVRRANGADVLSLDALLSDLPLNAGDRLCLFGAKGTGKSTALAHLAALLEERKGPSPHTPILLDEPSSVELEFAMIRGPVVFTSDRDFYACPTWSLAPWGTDEFIEYSIAADAARAGDVIPRALAIHGREPLDGSPMIWSAMLDLLHCHREATTLAGLLERALAKLTPAEHKVLGKVCIAATVHEHEFVHFPAKLDEPVARLLSHPASRVDLAARTMIENLGANRSIWWLPESLPVPLIEGCARHLSDRAADRLTAIMRGSKARCQPIAASILHAANRPVIVPPCVPCLARARLNGIPLARTELPNLQATRAQLSSADLSGANLSQARLESANLARAWLAGANLQDACLDHATLALASLSGATLEDASLESTDLSEANLEQLRAGRARFPGANLRSTRMVRADFTSADLRHADLTDADASGAIFDRARFQSADLRDTVLTGASFAGAMLRECNLAGIRIPVANLSGAALTECDLTGAILTNASLEDACLIQCGLADIDLEGADLRDCDFSGSTFHMGSSRSGLVSSPIACEGSKTGFYTEELEDFTHKTPEEVRRANLRGADLRGADIERVDFYLVDLRDARYSPDAGEWLRKCGAILQDWSPRP